MIRVPPASPDTLNRFLQRSSVDAPTYFDIGATATTALPTGFHHLRRDRRVGDRDDFARAKLGLQQWRAHEGARAYVTPRVPPAFGMTLLVVARRGPVQVIAPCRVVYLIDEPDRYGAAYGTLPGHPECGEESFVIERTEEGTMFRISVFSRPAQFVTKVAGPLGHLVQSRLTERYLQGLERFVRDAGRN